MALACPDTSFLFSLYGEDAHTAPARAWLQRHGAPLPVPALAEFELANALRCAEFRGLATPAEVGASLRDYRRDVAAGRLQPAAAHLRDLLAEAERLSARHSARGGHRTFDVLIVASATLLEAETFLTFDDRQRQLARLAGMKVAPATLA